MAYSAQRRGTVEYLKYYYERGPHFPRYWDLSKRGRLGRGELNVVSVDETTKKAIADLVMNTWDRGLVGRGNDAKGLQPYTDIEVLDVERVENTELYKKYRAKRQALIKKYIDENRVCLKIETVCKSHKAVATTMLLPEFLKEDMCLEINEHYLLHGTTVDRIGGITSGGLKTSAGGMLGSGIYQAEKSTKADQYAEESKFWTAPPPHDSVLAEEKWLFREFVVYNENQVYPEYVITYKRV